MSTKPRVSDERLSEMIANAGLYAYVADPGEVEGLARDLRDARAEIARLRESTEKLLGDWVSAYDHEVAIARLRAEIESLRGSLVYYPSLKTINLGETVDRIEALKAENERLRARIAELESGK